MNKFICIQYVDGEKFFNLSAISHINFSPRYGNVTVFFVGDSEPVTLKASVGRKFLECFKASLDAPAFRTAVEEEIAEVASLRS